MDRVIIIQRLKDRLLTQVEAATHLDVCERQVRRLLRRVEFGGFEALAPKYRGGNRLLKDEVKTRVITVVREKYSDFGPTFAAEKLSECEGLKVSRETLRKWMIDSGMWKRRARTKACIYQSRERRPRFGELVQIDGSHHDWFEGRSSKCCLLVFIDDATSKILGLYFDKGETTLGYMRVVKDHLRLWGRPLAYYSDRHSIFKTTREQSVDRRLVDTQLHRALRELKIELICAYSPQAKGRVERANQTLQDRLIKELRLRGISSIEQANAYMPEFVDAYNKKFAVCPKDPEDAHRPVNHEQAALDRTLSHHSIRKLSKNLEFSLDGRTYQILTKTTGYRLRHKEVTICQHIDGRMDIVCEGSLLEYKVLTKNPRTLEGDSKEINSIVDSLVQQLNCRALSTLPTGSTTGHS